MPKALALLAVLVSSTCYAARQDSTGTCIIRKIFIEGNRTTKPYIILRELPFKPGDSVTTNQLEYARERIYSTGLFSKVLTQVEPVRGATADLLIYVEERWYIWPYPVAGLQDRDWKKFYVGAGIIDLNFRGMNEQLSADFALGYDPFAAAMYRSPSIGEDKNYLVALGASFSRGRNFGLQSASSSGETDADFADIFFEGGRRIGIYSTLSATVSYNYVRARAADYTGLVLSPDGRDVFASLLLDYEYDSRDYRSYAMQGTFVDVSVEKSGLGESIVDFGRLSFDGREYIPLVSPLVFAGRIHGNIAEGPRIPPYDHVFFGYYERIRGMYNYILEGESLVGANFEIRIPIIRRMYLEFPGFPLKQFVSNRIALYWNFFGDAGETSGKYLDMTWRRLVYGYGGGLSLILPYDIIIQADFARGSDRHTEFILDLGATI